MKHRTFAEDICDWLVEEGYSHCFFLAGGNIMHLLDAARTRFECVPMTHEVSATVAAEYFNEVQDGNGRAFALVTAGPGITNALTGIAGAYTESRELLVLGGQVKTSDLSKGDVRQRGIQEIDGVAITRPVTKSSLRLDEPISKATFVEHCRLSRAGRKGPVFIEMPLDVQAAPSRSQLGAVASFDRGLPVASQDEVMRVSDLLRSAQRPMLLLGGGVDRQVAWTVSEQLSRLGIPIATTYNGSDRIGSDNLVYAGRPNTWGMRWANIFQQQADVLVALGSRLGLQQTGFNVNEFLPVGRLVHVDIDAAELYKGHPQADVAIQADANDFLIRVLSELQAKPPDSATTDSWAEWRAFGQMLRSKLPLSDPVNDQYEGYINPYDLGLWLSAAATPGDVWIPCSSGGAFTATYQVLLPKQGQVVISNKSLASMGYGLAGAIGAALAEPNRRVIHVEGDGGFAQNLNELGTVWAQNLNIKTFILVNDGYASIRMTQRNYFDGAWVGCDRTTGVGLPNWLGLKELYDIPIKVLRPEDLNDDLARELDARGPHVYLVPVHPEQTYFPKISSRVTRDGGMESAPLHMMSPPLDAMLEAEVMRYVMRGNS